MWLTAGEFCQFNIKSRIQLLEKEGALITIRQVANKYVIKLYSIYSFLVEVIVQSNNQQVIKADPVINGDIIEIFH